MGGLARRARRDPAAAAARAALPGRGLDAYVCTERHLTVTVQLDPGHVPTEIGCRSDGCTARARSQGHPDPWPADTPRAPTHEWYTPGGPAALRLKDHGGPLWDHVRGGGLLIRRRRATTTGAYTPTEQAPP